MTQAAYDEAVRRRALVINERRASEVGGCFYDGSEDDQGECADGDCYCARWCMDIARAIFTADTDAGFDLVPTEATEEIIHAMHKARPGYQKTFNAAIRKGAIREENDE